MSIAETPTGRWLDSVSTVMRPLEGAAGTAERLLLLLHYSIAWEASWVTGYRTTYWDKILPDRVYIATFRHSTLRGWWTDLATDLVAVPGTEESRELVQLLDEPAAPVLACLRDEHVALVLRVRIVAETRRAARAERTLLHAGR